MLKINILAQDLDKARKIYVNISKALDNSIDICVKPPRFNKITGRFSVSIESKNIDSRLIMNQLEVRFLENG